MAQKNAPPAPEQVAETFEAELQSIQEKGKDLKGDSKAFYNSIVERVANNVQVLADLRAEHTALRAQLAEQAKITAQHNTSSERIDLATEIRHVQHDVNLLKQKNDSLEQEKAESLARQEELEVILANFKNAELVAHPEEAIIAGMKNKLDRADIKNGEALHLIKLYQRIIYYLERQRMHFAPEIERQREIIARKGTDIKELVLIARDSKFSCTSAISEYRRTKSEVSDAKKRRNSMLENKRMQVMADKQQIEQEQTKLPTRAQPSLSSQPSVMRNRANRQQREKREEKLRHAQQESEQIRDFFGTNDPKKIQDFFQERRQTTETLSQQITELRRICHDLEVQANRLKSQIEEAEYTSSKGVGTARLLAEGRQMLSEKCDSKRKAERELAAVAQHQRTVATGALHLKELLSIVEGDEQIEGPKDALAWVHQKVVQIQKALDSEDLDWIAFANMDNFNAQRAKEDAVLEAEDQHRKVAKTQGFKRAKDNKLDVTTRVLDRGQVKALAAKTFTLHQQQQRKAQPGTTPK
jgi:hypothetical protein